MADGVAETKEAVYIEFPCWDFPNAEIAISLVPPKGGVFLENVSRAFKKHPPRVTRNNWGSAYGQR